MKHVLRTIDSKAWRENVDKWLLENFESNQLDILSDNDSVIEIDKERRCGTTYTLAAVALLMAIRGEDVKVITLNHATTIYFLNEMIRHVKSIKLVGFFGEPKADQIVKRIEVTGSSKGATRLRGVRSNVILDDFSSFSNRNEIWDAMLPCVSTGGKLIVSRDI